MKTFAILMLGIALCAVQTGCGNSSNNRVSPDELHKSCMALFERKGGPADLAKQMCDSMRQACEDDASGDECQKALRMVEKG